LTNHTIVASLWEGRITVYPLEKTRLHHWVRPSHTHAHTPKDQSAILLLLTFVAGKIIILNIIIIIIINIIIIISNNITQLYCNGRFIETRVDCYDGLITNPVLSFLASMLITELISCQN